ncbi:hypothetical protein LXL04_036433 [Taraxacum kok-saghyz]
MAPQQVTTLVRSQRANPLILRKSPDNWGKTRMYPPGSNTRPPLRKSTLNDSSAFHFHPVRRSAVLWHMIDEYLEDAEINQFADLPSLPIPQMRQDFSTAPSYPLHHSFTPPSTIAGPIFFGALCGRTICTPQGRPRDQNTAAKLTTSMFNSLKARPVQGRIYQEKEPPQFIAIFQPMVVFKGGLSSSYRTYSPDSSFIIRILGTAVHNNKAVQLDFGNTTGETPWIGGEGGEEVSTCENKEEQVTEIIEDSWVSAVQMRTIIGGGNGGTNLGHLFQFAADQFSDAGALLSVQHIYNMSNMAKLEFPALEVNGKN